MTPDQKRGVKAIIVGWAAILAVIAFVWLFYLFPSVMGKISGACAILIVIMGITTFFYELGYYQKSP